jgi:hypothetical protein
VSNKPSAALRYTALRFGIFVGSFLVIWGLVYLGVLPAGLGRSNLVWVLLLALVISAPLSWVLLRKQRDQMSQQLGARVDRARQKLSASRTQEDA